MRNKVLILVVVVHDYRLPDGNELLHFVVYFSLQKIGNHVYTINISDYIPKLTTLAKLFIVIVVHVQCTHKFM